MVDYSKLSRINDSLKKPSKVSDAKKAYKIRKAIKDAEDKDLNDIQAALAADGYEVTLEELEAARKQYEEDIKDSRKRVKDAAYTTGDENGDVSIYAGSMADVVDESMWDEDEIMDIATGSGKFVCLVCNNLSMENAAYLFATESAAIAKAKQEKKNLGLGGVSDSRRRVKDSQYVNIEELLPDMYNDGSKYDSMSEAELRAAIDKAVKAKYPGASWEPDGSCKKTFDNLLDVHIKDSRNRRVKDAGEPAWVEKFRKASEGMPYFVEDFEDGGVTVYVSGYCEGPVEEGTNEYMREAIEADEEADELNEDRWNPSWDVAEDALEAVCTKLGLVGYNDELDACPEHDRFCITKPSKSKKSATITVKEVRESLRWFYLPTNEDGTKVSVDLTRMGVDPSDKKALNKFIERIQGYIRQANHEFAGEPRGRKIFVSGEPTVNGDDLEFDVYFGKNVADSRRRVKDDEDANHQEKPVDGSGDDVPEATPQGTNNDVVPPAEPIKKTYDSIKFARTAKNKRQIKDSYSNLLKKIKDDLEDTESTEEAIDAALANITEETPAEDVLAAVVEVLGETIDKLSADTVDEAPEEAVDEAPEEAVDEAPEEAVDEAPEDIDAAIEDCKKQLKALRLKKIASK